MSGPWAPFPRWISYNLARVANGDHTRTPEQWLAELDQRLIEFGRKLEEHDLKVAEHDRLLKEHDQKVAAHDQAVAEHDKKVAAHDRLMVDFHQFKELFRQSSHMVTRYLDKDLGYADTHRASRDRKHR